MMRLDRATRQDIDNVLYADIPDCPKLRKNCMRKVLTPYTASGAPSSPRYRITQIHALLHAGEADRAAELAERYITNDFFADISSMSARDTAVSFCVLSELFLLNGDSRLGAVYARHGLENAAELNDEGVGFWAASLHSCAKAAAGELTDGVKSFKQAISIAKTEEWTGAWPLHFALQRISTRAQLMHSNLPKELPTDTHRDPVLVAGVAKSKTIIMQLRQHDYQSLISTVEELTMGVESKMLPSLIVNAATFIAGLAFMQVGASAEVFQSIGDKTSSHGHTICYPILLASAYINIGDASSALRVTEECVNMGSEHCVGSLASILVRRAVAFEMLDRHEEADRMFSRASHLGMQIGAISPLVGLPMSIIEPIYWRLINNEPEFGKLVQQVIPPDAQYRGSTGQTPNISALTQREKLVASYLITSMTFDQIASKLSVSVNTVKSQVQSIYKKLGVSNRKRATGLLYDYSWLLNYSAHHASAATIAPPPRK